MKTICTLFKTSASIAAISLLSHHALSAAEKPVAAFTNDEAVKGWTSVNDGVMGGVSKGGFKRSEQGTLVFSGELSLANNGGFASVRMKETDLGLAGTSVEALSV